MVSHDTRKRIIYYETYRTDIEQLLANDQERQGVRTRLNLRPVKLIHVGLSYAKRYQVNSDNQSDNVSVYVGHSSLPKIGGRASLSLNFNQSSYLKSKVVSLRYSREIIPRKLNMDFYAGYVNYSYVERPIDSNQQYAGASFLYNMRNKTLLIGLG
ncbi:MAG: hypothetical protein GY816_20105 [Cytophagales bacterium]|nr:hypothetical protein [Cytophagales bacterium]